MPDIGDGMAYRLEEVADALEEAMPGRIGCRQGIVMNSCREHNHPWFEQESSDQKLLVQYPVFQAVTLVVHQHKVDA